MAHKRDYKPEDILFPNQHITESELVSEMQNSYIDYAMSVIVGRALPDVPVRVVTAQRQALQEIRHLRGRCAGPLPPARGRLRV